MIVYFTNMAKVNGITYFEYLHIAHGIKGMNVPKCRVKDMGLNLPNFLPEPRSLSHVSRLSPNLNEKWGEAIRSELVGLFDGDNFSSIDKYLPAEIIPPKLALKTNINSYGGLDKLKARMCKLGGMQIKNGITKSWSPTAST